MNHKLETALAQTRIYERSPYGQ